MKKVRLNVAGIHRQPTTDRFENSSSWTSTNPFRTSGPNDLSMPGNRKLANAHPPTTYQAQLSSNVRCWRSCLECWWGWSWFINVDGPAVSRETHIKNIQTTKRMKRHRTRGNSGLAKEVFWMFKHSDPLHQNMYVPYDSDFYRICGRMVLFCDMWRLMNTTESE